ncbi:hypothetical protein PRIPAC_70415 [Pristionchus pacificus]|uniref:CWH43-like N-terminal domain-containing protein n=1 Tax=Pristionchus pacificus TaxID=54126 RepID=A0A2A6C038_PRIPA|nr:hypothetical protein PRIPAC_70415 [Pristionchus pacificus]|eukprot:PDM71466.1 hypothetical protein PRIPAC_37873 [Pristionchus pacificus]
MSTTNSCRSLIDRRQSPFSVPGPSLTAFKPLLSFTASSLNMVSLFFPVAATVIAAAFAVTVDRHRLFDYYWVCEKVLLPSFSRMINLPLERTFWNLLILAHVPLRVLSLFLYYVKFSSSASSARASTLLTSVTLLLFIVAGAFDLTFLSLLTVVGERESGFLHMVFFICFILSTEAFMAAHLLLSIRCGVKGRKETVSFRLRLFLFFALIITVALLTTAFSLFQGYCVPYSYSTFAGLEYCTIAMILMYHSTALLDLDFRLNVVYTGKEC